MSGKENSFWAFKLSGIIIILFLMQMVSKGFTDLFVLNDSAIYAGQIWRFLSAVFLHGSITHLLFNLFALMLFGGILESLIGSKKFLLVFFVTGILANIFSVNFYPSSLGASGAIFGVIGALIVIRPGLPVWAFGMPMPIFIAGIVWVGADVLGTVGYFTGNPIDNTGNIAHLSGMFFGFVFGAIYRNFMNRKKNPSINIKLDENSIRRWEDDYLR